MDIIKEKDELVEEVGKAIEKIKREKPTEDGAFKKYGLFLDFMHRLSSLKKRLEQELTKSQLNERIEFVTSLKSMEGGTAKERESYVYLEESYIKSKLESDEIEGCCKEVYYNYQLCEYALKAYDKKMRIEKNESIVDCNCRK